MAVVVAEILPFLRLRLLPTYRHLGHMRAVMCALFRDKWQDTSDHLCRDDAHGRVLTFNFPDTANMTVEACVAICSAQNSTLAGLEFSVQCCMSSYNNFNGSGSKLTSLLVCGDEIVNGGVLATLDSDCNMLCGGNSSYVSLPALLFSSLFLKINP